MEGDRIMAKILFYVNLLLSVMGVGYNLAKEGQYKPREKYSFVRSLIIFLLSVWLWYIWGLFNL